MNVRKSKQEQQVDRINKFRKGFVGLDEDGLRSLWSEMCGLRVENVEREAAWAVEMSEQEYDLSDIEGHEYLLKIGRGQLLTEVFLRYGPQERKLMFVERLPLDLQEKTVGDSPRFSVKVRRADATYTERMMDPLEMSMFQMYLVFHRSGRLRSDSEQIAILEDRFCRNACGDAEVTQGFVTNSKGVQITGPDGRVFLTWRQVAEIQKVRSKYRNPAKSGK